MYNKITNTTKEEKEHALSLLRIPLNFFSEDDKKVTTKNNEEVKIDSDTTSSPLTKRKIKAEDNNSTIHINISEDLEFTQTNQPSSSSKSSIKNNDTFMPSSTYNHPENATTHQESSTDKPENSNKKNEKPSAPTTPAPQNQENQLNTPPNQNLETITNEINELDDATSTEELQNNNQETPSIDESYKEPTISSHSDESLDDNFTKEHDLENSTPSTKTTNKSSDTSSTNEENSDELKNKKVDELKDKFNNSDAGKKLNNVKEKAKDKLNNSAAGKKLNDTKNQALDKIANNPKASQALGSLKDAKNTLDTAKDAVNNLDAEKMQEALGDAAVKVAGQAGDTVVPGAGKVIKAADKIIGNTKVGKSAKKAFGGCLFATGCLIPILVILIPLVVMMQGFSWITDQFSRDNTIYGNFNERDWERLQEASTEYSMQSYTDLVSKLNDPTFLQTLFGTASDYPLQDALEKYMSDYYKFTQEEVDIYYSKYGDLIEAGYLMPFKEGDLTSFGMAFEILKKNYSVHNLKAPASAPQRVKTINGKEVKYTTYDPTGIHQALFEDVLNNFDELKARFNGQVSEEWFNELNEMLDKPFPVYLKGVDDPKGLDDPSLIPTRTLRELFIETSRQINDTEYYAALINSAFTENSGTNAQIVAEYNKLVDRLAMLELMTYTLSYQKFYSQIDVFKRNFTNSKYVNASMFNEEFFAQFLTFSNVEYYLALSNLSDHSLTYEIAVASIDGSINNIETTEMKYGNNNYLAVTKFDNWFATYYLNPEIVVTGENEISYTMVPTMNKTQTQQFLFDKYNVEADIFENVERSAAQNQNSFFAAFELATGLDMAVIDDYGNEQTPIYYLNSDGVVSTTLTYLSGTSNVPGTIAGDKSLPLSPEAAARVSFGFGQTYSQATIDKFGWADGKTHAGIDYSIPSGTTVLSAASGTAYVVRGNTGWGNYVKVVHDDGHVSYYAHGNGTFYVQNGQRVNAGQAIMQSGNSGNSTGPHLHFEIRNPSGTVINPNTYISE